MSDPTYDRTVIDADPVWKLAFVMSEIANDGAPIGWGKYIPLAHGLLAIYDLTEKSRG
jgi:hypothetical protein